MNKKLIIRFNIREKIPDFIACVFSGAVMMMICLLESRLETCYSVSAIIKDSQYICTWSVTDFSEILILKLFYLSILVDIGYLLARFFFCLNI